MVEDPKASVTGFGRATMDTQEIEGRTFRRWNGTAMSGDTIRIDFGSEDRGSERWILAALVGVIGLVLAVATWRYRALAGIVLAVGVSLAGCQPSPAGRGAISIVDDAGDTTALRGPATRVVSLVPAVTELLFAIGAGDAVVGRTAWCDYPPAAAAVANVGDGINPNVEALLARRPDLVVLYRSTQHAAVVERLRSLGIAAVQLKTDALRDVGRVARVLGRLTGHDGGADSLAAAFDVELRAATAARSSSRPKILLLVWDQPPMTVGTGSFLSEIVERAGGDNLFADLSATSATISVEAVAARDPDLVLLAAEGPTAFTARPEWQVVRAIRAQRFVRVGGSAFSHPGPRSPAAVRELAQRVRDAGAGAGPGR